MAGLTILADVVLSFDVIEAGGLRGRLMRKNDRAQTQGGYQRANVVWQHTLRQYELGFQPMLLDAWKDIVAIFEVTDAGAYGFLLEDPADSECTTDTGLVAQDGSDWRLYKRYASGSQYRDRPIKRPRSGVVVYVNDVPATVTVSTTTGIVTFDTDPEEGDTVTWAGSFLVPVHFADDQIDWTLRRSGGYDDRLVEGPTVMLQEVRE